MKRLIKEKLADILRIDKAFLCIVLVDIILYLSLAGSIFLLNLVLLETFSPLENAYATFEKLDSFYGGSVPENPEGFKAELEAAQDIMRSVLINSVFIFVVYYILIVALTSFLKSFIWAKISNQKFSFRFFRKFLLLNYIWMSFWIVVFVLSFMLIKEKANLFILGLEFLFFVYSSSVVRAFFNEKEGIFRIIKNGVKACFKIDMLSLAYIAVSFIAFVSVGYLMFFVLKGMLFAIIILVLFSIYSAFVRRCIFFLVS